MSGRSRKDRSGTDLPEQEGVLPEASSLEASEKKKTKKKKVPKEKKKSSYGGDTDSGERRESVDTLAERQYVGTPLSAAAPRRGSGLIRKASEERFSTERFRSPQRSLMIN